MNDDLVARLTIISKWLRAGAWPVGESTCEFAADDIEAAQKRIATQHQHIGDLELALESAQKSIAKQIWIWDTPGLALRDASARPDKQRIAELERAQVPREPTGAMIDAVRLFAIHSPTWDATSIWQVMYDAALADPKSESNNG